MTPLLLTLLVVVDGTPIVARPTGPTLAMVGAGVELSGSGGPRGGWAPVSAQGAVSLAGFVRRDRLGCRAATDVELVPLGRSLAARVRRGALLRAIRPRGELVEVVTIGLLELRGTVPRTACVVPGAPYFDGAPPEGELRATSRPTALAAQPGGTPLLRLPANVRFVVREAHDGWAGGRTDGPVVVDGWVRADDLGDPQVGSPLDVLTRPLDHTHEILADTAVSLTRRGRAPAFELRGGTAINVIESSEDVVRVRTTGQIAAEGWVAADLVREVTASEESITLPSGVERQAPPLRGPRLLVP